MSVISLFVVCQLDQDTADRLTKLKQYIFCGTQTEICNVGTELIKDNIYSNTIIILINKQMIAIETILHQVSLCNKKYILVDITQKNKILSITKACYTFTKSTIVVNLVSSAETLAPVSMLEKLYTSPFNLTH